MTDLVEAAPKRGLSIFLQTPPGDDPARVYAEVVENIELAEQSGYEVAWLAEAHFAPIGLPAALTVLAVAAHRTTTIRLGTGVIPLIFDNPLRLAEQAAVTDHLAGGRLELGIGKGNGHGFSTSAFEAFRLAEDDRQALYDAGYAQLKIALSGVIEAGGKHLHVYPPPQGLLSRLWQATATPENAASIGRSGDGLLLHRLAFEGDTGIVQSALIDRYLEAYASEVPPRIGVSRSVLPAESKRDALALIHEDFAKNPAQYTGFGASSPEEYLQRSNVFYGSVEDIVRRLNDDSAVVRSTDYLFSIPLRNASGEFREALRVISDEVYPKLPLSSAIPAL